MIKLQALGDLCTSTALGYGSIIKPYTYAYAYAYVYIYISPKVIAQRHPSVSQLTAQEMES